jgi:hypothetical protein
MHKAEMAIPAIAPLLNPPPEEDSGKYTMEVPFNAASAGRVMLPSPVTGSHPGSAV